MKPIAFTLIIISSLLMSFTTTAAAQQTGKIYGTVTDTTGAVVPNVKISVKMKSPAKASAPASAHQTDISANDIGDYSVENLSPGLYSLKAEMHGMSYENEKVHIRTGQTVKLNIQLSFECCEEESRAKRVKLSDTDKKEIINQILDDALARRNIPDYNSLVEHGIILSLRNIKAEWITPNPDIKLKLMSQKEIQNKADRQENFSYISFGRFTITPKGIVVLLTSNVVGKNAVREHLSFASSYYIFQKKDGKWIREAVGGWVS